MVDQLAKEYAGKPVVFIEYDVDNAPQNRYSIIWDSGITGMLPMTMIDSGHEFKSGYVDFYQEYKGMVDRSLARPARAEIQAYWWREGNAVKFSVQLKNTSGLLLSYANNAAVHAIVYEDIHEHDTDRFSRASVKTEIENLPHGATGIYELSTGNLTGVNWDKLHYVVLVDYRTGVNAPFDQLQAAVAQPSDGNPFMVNPAELALLIDTNDTIPPFGMVSVKGLPILTWSATSDSSWITINPSSGAVNTNFKIDVNASQLLPGWQVGNVEVKDGTSTYIRSVVVRVYLGKVYRVMLPVVLH